MKNLSVAVLTGGHSYDVIAFRDLFRNLQGITAYVQHMDDFCSSSDEVRDGYDVVVLYFMPAENPTDEGTWYEGKHLSAIKRLMSGTGQGIVVLHHAILAYKKWDEWGDFVDIQDRTFEFYNDQKIEVSVSDPNHAITKGISTFTTTDESYLMSSPSDASHTILTTEHPRCIKVIGWTREIGKSKVFYFQLGHDAKAWATGEFKTILTQGVQWTAKGGN